MFEILRTLSNYIGIFGVAIILVAYFLLSTGRWAADSLVYQSLNFMGAWLILFSLYFHWNLSSVLIEIAWIIISTMGLVRTVLQRRVGLCVLEGGR